jgi:uncharacterized protein (DUF362 family)
MSMDTKSGIDRRQFLWTVGSLSSMALLGGVSFAFDNKKTMTTTPVKNAKVSVAWLPKGETPYAQYKQVIENATDFSWLHKNDRILVKLALNSGNLNPATTDPWGLDCLLKVLKEHGASKIFVGDSSGCRFVYWNAKGQVRGSTREFAKTSGCLDVIEANGATPVFFEERGYDAYIATVPKGEHHWKKEPMRVTSFVNEVDHIIYAPRLSSHMLADFSSGMKIGVGFLREDSRKRFHSSGANFHPMYEEINEVPEIKSKLRLTVTTGRRVQTIIGPDVGHIVEPTSAPIFASENLLAHELYAYGYLMYTRATMTPKEVALPALGPGTLWEIQRQRTVRNRGFLKYVWNLEADEVPELVDFNPGDIYKHPAIVNYMRLNSGQNVKFSVLEINQNTDAKARQYLQRTLKV